MTGRRPSDRRNITWRCARIACVLILNVALLAPIPLARAAAAAVSFVWSSISLTHLRQDDPQEQAAQTPARNYAPRIKLPAGSIRELTFGEAIVAVTVLDPTVAAAETKAERGLFVTGLNVGETILIISGMDKRSTYVIQVVRPPRASRSNVNEALRNESAGSFSGFYGIHFSPGTDSVPSLLRHSFEFNQKLPSSRTLRASGELFNFMGRGERGLARPLGGNFRVNRLRLGLDSPGNRFDVLDSELEISRLSFNNYTMRGLHLVSKPDSRLKGLEIFAGRARPQASFFNDGEGLLAGVLAPVAQGPSWRVRAGVFFVSPERLSSGRESGIIWHADARYAPDENTLAEAETTYADGNFSWRTRLDLRRGPFNFHAELLRLDPHSPLVRLGAQTAGRKLNSFSLQWRPLPRFGASLSYNSTTNSPLSTLRRVELNTRTLTAAASYAPMPGARLSLSFHQQELEHPATLPLPFLLNLRTRAVTFRYGQRIGHGWTNEFEARLIESREGQTAEQVTDGLSLREQLRFSWRRGSVASFINYRSNTPSLTGLILRNPLLLPAELRPAFTTDPARFILTNRDALPELLSGVELPATRNTEAGLRLQAAFSRLNLAGEVRYSTGEILARNERNILATFSADLKLDAANSIQVSGARAFSFSDTESRTALTVSYVHRFGSASGGGFQFSKLLGLSRGRVQGRVFFDLNGNGQDDTNEPGVAGMKVQLDGNHTRTTDERGNFNFSALEPGEHTVALASEDLGVKLRASNATLRQLILPARETIHVSFGLTNVGFAQGRIFNDLLLAGEMSAAEAPGVEGVRIILRPPLTGSANALQPLSEIVNSSGMYEFRNLPPGSYILEIDPTSLPADFRLHGQMAWPVTINPLQGSFLDVPLIAQRAVSGIVFIDNDDNGQFDSQTDETVKRAKVVAGNTEALTDDQGSYILRNLPAGKLEVLVYLPFGRKSKITSIELGANPVYRKNLNLPVHK